LSPQNAVYSLMRRRLVDIKVGVPQILEDTPVLIDQLRSGECQHR
jgi:hypothetical protein